MQPMILAFVAIIAIAFGADQLLNNADFSSSEQNTASAVRVD